MKDLAALARAQHGAFSVAQARDAGISRQALETMHDKGLIERRLRGVYAFVGAELSHQHRIHAALLWAGDAGTLSHSSAAWLHGLEIDILKPELTLPHSRVAPRGIELHRAVLEPSQVIRVRRIAVTSIPRTVLDLCAVDPTLAEALLDDALRRKATTLKACDGLLSSIGGRGVAGTRPMRMLIERRLNVRGHVDSRMERRFTKLMDGCGIPRPVLQHRVQLDGSRYRLDFAYPDLKLGIEVDTWRHHLGRLAWDEDLQRRNRFTIGGWTLIHVTSEQIIKRPGEVSLMVESAYHDLRSRTPLILGETARSVSS